MDTSEKTIENLLSQMTLKEKIGQLNQAGSTMTCTLPGFEADIDGWVTQMLEGRLSQEEFGRRIAMCEENLREDEIASGSLGNFVNLYDDEKVAAVQKIACEESRMHIPLFIGVDVMRGYRTVFPTPLALSCSWDLQAVRESTAVAKREAYVSGVNWTFGPMLDIARDARWGRIVESPGEDPYLASEIGKVQVETFQEEEADGCRLMATAKHFLAYGAASGGQDYNTVEISRHTLYDVYLPPFQAAIDAGAGAVMSAFHDLEGTPCTMSRWLLTDLLRKQMGFDGFVVSDAEAVKQCVVHGTAADERDAAKKCLLAGGDMDMSSLDYVRYLEELVESGEVSEKDIDRAAGRVLKKKLEFGLFDRGYQYDPEKIQKTVLCSEHRRISLEVGKKSAVLLKNNGVLPIGKEAKKILIIGELADDKDAHMGPWSFTGVKEAQVTILQGMKDCAPEETEIIYARGFGVNDDRSGFEEALSLAREADFVIAVAGETAFMSGEAASRADLHLVGAQEEFLEKLSETGVPAAVVLINGRPLAIGSLQENDGIGAILEAWHLGTEMGHAVAQILYGDYNPSGRLSVTFANEGGQEPMYYNHPNTGKPGGSFKFTSKYQDVPIRPLYPFGYGLSYTGFEYSDLEVENPVLKKDQTLKVKVVVKNIGERSGEETVQLYIRDITASLVRPVKELKRFAKIRLEAGEMGRVEFSLPCSEMGFHDSDGTFVVEPGKFMVYVGGSSEQTLDAEYELV
ncbi:MAG: glycoside hydrolase family 3 C-terminal domain-containing protein [Clostridiales bacterium]|nr:glycoside hydrolase family 3 C-terminal domain-containing protein [Clostridiales bacterium]